MIDVAAVEEFRKHGARCWRCWLVITLREVGPRWLCSRGRAMFFSAVGVAESEWEAPR